MYLDFLNMYVVNKAHALKKEQGILVEPAKNLFLYLWQVHYFSDGTCNGGTVKQLVACVTLQATETMF